jgi:hypothetical protein
VQLNLYNDQYNKIMTEAYLESSVTSIEGILREAEDSSEPQAYLSSAASWIRMVGHVNSPSMKRMIDRHNDIAARKCTPGQSMPSIMTFR